MDIIKDLIEKLSTGVDRKMAVLKTVDMGISILMSRIKEHPEEDVVTAEVAITDVEIDTGDYRMQLVITKSESAKITPMHVRVNGIEEKVVCQCSKCVSKRKEGGSYE